MRYRLLGRTGLYVSELCLGTMTYGGKGFWEQIGALPQDAVTAQVKVAVEAGINFIDTANVYSIGESERLLGQALKDLAVPRDQVVVATKATGIMDETPNGRGQSRYHLFNAVEASLRRLQLDHIDLYQLHGFDPLTPLEEVLGALEDLVRSGKVRYVGLCNMAAWQVMKALAVSERRGWSRFESVQGVLHDRKPRPRARAHATDARSGPRTDGVEPARGRTPERQVPAAGERSRGRAPHDV